MENELRFARKISFKPLLGSIFLGVAVGVVIISIFPNEPLMSILCGTVAFLIDSMLIYPWSLKHFYGGWKITAKGIYYIDDGTWNKKVKLIYLPFLQQDKFIPLSEIQAFSIIDGVNLMNSHNIAGGTLNRPINRPEHLLIVETRQGQVTLNLSWNYKGEAVSDKKINQILAILKNSSR
ncbi:hypothetical protein [Companilactobacillus bobalius]|nr:hypothetical protein [Companilactobacillus bobalius]KAE9557115.1 hypothetical protein ATN92_17790 [Companilactobacillus bobalius]OVE98778.1 hypothetical protein LKACC16343_00940 [Companilactobacillus bobalius]GEO57952.1 hypothetical protein LBO01_10810 [Companilactobacillus paralimentarius]